MHAKLYNTMHGWWELHHIRDVTFVLIAITYIFKETLQYCVHWDFETVKLVVHCTINHDMITFILINNMKHENDTLVSSLMSK